MPDPAPVTIATLPLLPLLIAGRYRSPMRGRRVALALVSAIVATGALIAVDGVGRRDPPWRRSPPTTSGTPRRSISWTVAPGRATASASPPVPARRPSAPCGRTFATKTDRVRPRAADDSAQRDGRRAHDRHLRRPRWSPHDLLRLRELERSRAERRRRELRRHGPRVHEQRGQLEFPPGTDAEAQATLQQLETQLSTLSMPLPFEAVGVGARWKVTEHPVANGLASTRSVVYTLVERTDNRIVLRSKLRQTAHPSRSTTRACRRTPPRPCSLSDGRRGRRPEPRLEPGAPQRVDRAGPNRPGDRGRARQPTGPARSDRGDEHLDLEHAIGRLKGPRLGRFRPGGAAVQSRPWKRTRPPIATSPWTSRGSPRPPRSAAGRWFGPGRQERRRRRRRRRHAPRPQHRRDGRHRRHRRGREGRSADALQRRGDRRRAARSATSPSTRSTAPRSPRSAGTTRSR